MMTKYFTIFVIGLALVCFSMVSQGFAQEKQEEHVVEQQKLPVAHEMAPPAITGTAALGVFSKYIFRGYELSKDSVAIQPGLSASYGGFSASFWGNIDTKEHATQNFTTPDSPGHKSFNETDITLSYTKTFDKLSLTGGYVYYGTRYANETEEVFGTVSYDMIGKPTLSIYQDFSAYPGTYFNFSLAHSIKVYGETTLDLGASAGYEWGQGNYWKTNNLTTGEKTGSKYSAFHDGKLQAGLTIPVTQKVSVVPIVQYWFPLSDKAKSHSGSGVDALSYNPNGYLKNLVVGGMSINYNF